MRFHKIPRFVKYVYPEAVWHGYRSSRKVYLSFDDGPNPGVTDYVLDVLRDFQVKATFFLVGENVQRNLKTFERLISEGHCIGNHTHNHLNGWKVPEQKYLRNIDLCQNMLKTSGWTSDVLLFRPPYGKICKKTLRKVREKYEVIMWDVLSYDFSDSIDSAECLKQSLNHTENGSIIIFHDSEKTYEKIKNVISQYVSSLLDEGYEFQKISELIRQIR